MNRDEKLRRLEGMLRRVVSRREAPRVVPAPEALTSPAAVPVAPVAPAPEVVAAPVAASLPPSRPAIEVTRVTTPFDVEFDPDLATPPPPPLPATPPPTPSSGGLEIEHTALMGYSPFDAIDTRERSSVQPSRPSAEVPTIPPPGREFDDSLLEVTPPQEARKGPHPALSVLEEPPPRGSVVSIAPVEPTPRPSVVQLTPLEPPPRPSVMSPSVPPAPPEARPSMVAIDPFAPPPRPSVVVAPSNDPPARPSVVTMNPQEPPARPSLLVSAMGNAPGARGIPQMPPPRNLAVHRYDAPEIPGFDSIVTVQEPPPLPANATLRTMLRRSLGLKLHSR